MSPFWDMWLEVKHEGRDGWCVHQRGTTCWPGRKATDSTRVLVQGLPSAEHALAWANGYAFARTILEYPAPSKIEIIRRIEVISTIEVAEGGEDVKD